MIREYGFARFAAVTSLFCSLTICMAQSVSDEGFNELLEELRWRRSETLLKIAHSGHPRALEVLRAIEAAGDQKMLFGEFKAKHGYPNSAPDGAYLLVEFRQLRIALAAAGDDESFDQIVEGFSEMDSDEKYDVIRILVRVRSDKAIRYLASLLYSSDEPVKFLPLPMRAAEALHDVLGGRGPGALDISGLTEDGIRSYVSEWRQWWREHAHEYGAEQPAEFPTPPASQSNPSVVRGDSPEGFVPPIFSESSASGGVDTESRFSLWPILLAFAALAALASILVWRARRSK